MTMKKNIDEIPAHVAIIMDGNRRWAKKKNLPSVMGHKEGEKTFHKIVECCSNIGVKVLTVYAFSSENWKRSAEEVGALMNLFEFYIKLERKYILEENIKFKIIGDKSALPKSLIKEFENTEKATENAGGMILNLAVNYGSRGEITETVKKIAKKVLSGEINIDEITEDTISSNLMTWDLPDPDLLIRTSGEERLSNFLLWQLAYSEFYFTDVLWPDFDEQCLLKAFEEYKMRNRRFGGGV